MTPSASDCGIIVFVRFPQYGKVKTRLAATTGDASALIIYNKLVSITLNIASNLPFPVYLFYEGRLPNDAERDPRYSYHIQSDGDLGHKMADAISFVLQIHAKAIIIGSDCPELTGELIMEGFSLLDQHDVVIGPAADGGYYLLGCKSLYPFLFENMAWSRPDVLEKTMERINQQRLSPGILSELHDVDTEEDWIRFLFLQNSPDTDPKG